MSPAGSSKYGSEGHKLGSFASSVGAPGGGMLKLGGGIAGNPGGGLLKSIFGSSGRTGTVAMETPELQPSCIRLNSYFFNFSSISNHTPKLNRD